MLRRLYDLAKGSRRNPLFGLRTAAEAFLPARDHAASHRDAMRDPRDATVLYDDIWGAP